MELGNLDVKGRETGEEAKRNKAEVEAPIRATYHYGIARHTRRRRGAGQSARAG